MPLDENKLYGDMELVAKTCGIEVAAKLMKHCKGMNLYIPREDHFTKDEVREAIVRLHVAGAKPKEIATTLGVSAWIVKDRLKTYKSNLSATSKNNRKG